MSFIYLIDSDALWYIHVLLQALWEIWDLDARVHLSVEGKSFSEGAIALRWPGLKLHRLTALKLRWPFLLYITCIWIQNQCKRIGKKPHHAQVQTQAESKISAPNRKKNRIQCKSLPCCSPAKPAAPHRGRCSSLGDGDGV